MLHYTFLLCTMLDIEVKFRLSSGQVQVKFNSTQLNSKLELELELDFELELELDLELDFELEYELECELDLELVFTVLANQLKYIVGWLRFHYNFSGFNLDGLLPCLQLCHKPFGFFVFITNLSLIFLVNTRCHYLLEPVVLIPLYRNELIKNLSSRGTLRGTHGSIKPQKKKKKKKNV